MWGDNSYGWHKQLAPELQLLWPRLGSKRFRASALWKSEREPKRKEKKCFFFSVLAKNSNRNDCYAYTYAKTSLGHGLSLPWMSELTKFARNQLISFKCKEYMATAALSGFTKNNNNLLVLWRRLSGLTRRLIDRLPYVFQGRNPILLLSI